MIFMAGEPLPARSLAVRAANTAMNWLGRATARELGLPHARVDHAYLANVRDTAEIIITDQIAYHRAIAPMRIAWINLNRACMRLAKFYSAEPWSPALRGSARSSCRCR